MFFLQQTFPLLVSCHKVCALSQPVALSAPRQINTFFSLLRCRQLGDSRPSTCSLIGVSETSCSLSHQIECNGYFSSEERHEWWALLFCSLMRRLKSIFPQDWFQPDRFTETDIFNEALADEQNALCKWVFSFFDVTTVRISLPDVNFPRLVLNFNSKRRASFTCCLFRRVLKSAVAVPHFRRWGQRDQ